MIRLLVNIDVPDLARAIAFYQDALGLHLARRLGDDVVEMLGANAPVYLLQTPAGSPPFAGAALGRQYQRHWTPVHLDLAVDELTPALERALAAGAVQEGEVQHFDWGSMARLADPFGHGICLIEFSSRGYQLVRA